MVTAVKARTNRKKGGNPAPVFTLSQFNCNRSSMKDEDKYGKQETMPQKSMRLIQSLIWVIKTREVFFNTEEQRTLNEAIDLVDEFNENKEKTK